LKKAPLLNPENLIAETHTRFGVFFEEKKILPHLHKADAAAGSVFIG
jgi:hypothetical protein